MLQHTEPPCTSEQDILYWADNATKNTRCSCKIVLNPEMDGMTVGLPIYADEVDGDTYNTEKDGINQTMWG